MRAQCNVIVNVNVNHKFFTWLKQSRLSQSPRRCSVEFKELCQEMTFEIKMSSADAEKLTEV